MHLFRFRIPCLAYAVLILTGGCAATTTTPTDYSAYRAHMPKSVLVLPPLNQSVEVNAPYVYLSTITRPLAECGYYVFPVAVVDALMKENGLPTPAEMHSVSLKKIREVFGADAVLYATIEEYGQKYQVLSSTTIVKARARLVDVATGTTLWEGTAQAARSSGDSNSGLVGMLVTAAITQVVNTATDQAHPLMHQANAQMVLNTQNGLLLGPYNPGYTTDTRGR